MKFCANLSFMFTDKPFVERYSLAKEAGFRFVETGFPLGCSMEEVTKAKNEAGLEQILINIYTGDTSKGELGVTFDPAKVQEFQDNLNTTIEYATSLKCTFVHVMAGIIKEKPTDVHWETYASNLQYAADRFKEKNLIGLIEPINNYSVPNYFMNSYDRAIEMIQKIDSKHMRLMMDLFHMQHIRGNLTNNIKELLPYVGHIQIAQVPHRNEPDTPGEVNYKYILDLLNESGYKGYVGLEYKPLKGTKDGLSWVKKYNYEL